MADALTVAKRPCGTCPYRRDVPSGIWVEAEYDKLPGYDGEITDQLAAGATGVFMCHQRDGNLCAGWLACHGSDNLLALRLPHNFDPKVFGYKTDVPLFASGAEARAHGIAEIDAPSHAAERKIQGLMKQRQLKEEV